MQILVLNGGSSSIKFSIFTSSETDPSALPALQLDGELSGIGSDARLDFLTTDGDTRDSRQTKMDAESTEQAIAHIFDALSGWKPLAIDAVGYRVVHPGPRLRDHQKITDAVLGEIEAASSFAPLHNPDALKVIRFVVGRLPDTPHYACFDTVFHQTMPVEASTYALPAEWREQGIRRYGFHGLSCEWIVRQMRDGQGQLPRRMIVAHLGSGCSVTAVLNGHSIDTTMGFTPTGGIVMGTRPGDLDPSILLYLLRQQKGDLLDISAKIESAINHKSGMVGISQLANDMQVIRKAASNGDEHALLAVKIFVRSVVKAIGSFSWLMGNVDAIVFTGGIGEHDVLTRSETLANLADLGLSVDAEKNRAESKEKREISAAESRTQIYVIPALEDEMIAIHVLEMTGAAG